MPAVKQRRLGESDPVTAFDSWLSSPAMDHQRDGGRPRNPDHPHPSAERHERREERGPVGTEFLDLEISKLLYGQATRLATEAARQLLLDAIKERLRERLGDRLA